jgi:hypothetical protein
MQKQFKTQNNIGRAKYTISDNDGVKTHLDGSPFFGIMIFSNKIKFNTKVKQLLKEGYVEI